MLKSQILHSQWCTHESYFDCWPFDQTHSHYYYYFEGRCVQGTRIRFLYLGLITSIVIFFVHFTCRKCVHYLCYCTCLPLLPFTHSICVFALVFTSPATTLAPFKDGSPHSSPLQTCTFHVQLWPTPKSWLNNVLWLD